MTEPGNQAGIPPQQPPLPHGFGTNSPTSPNEPGLSGSAGPSSGPSLSGSSGPAGPSGSSGPSGEPTAPLWFGDRSSERYPQPAPVLPEWATPAAVAPPMASSPPRARRQWPAVVAAASLAAVLASGGTYAALQLDDAGASGSTASASSVSTSSSAGNTATGIVQVDPTNPNWSATASTVSPSVVAISLDVQGGSAQGSGVVIDTAGHILTNNHVVDGAQAGTIDVTLSDGRIFPATVAGTDPSTDLAVITLDKPPTDLAPIAMGDSDALTVGDPVMAVGNPLGLAGTVTTGIVSALNRPVTTSNEDSQFGQAGERVVTNAIQTSAAINPGNSGGALVNANGQLIGINSAIASTSSSSGNIGIGFAIPVNEATYIAQQLIATGAAEHAYLGVYPVDGQASDGDATRAGAQLQRVDAGTPAATAGLEAGDVIIAVDGRNIESALSLVGKIREQKIGDAVKLTLVRDGQRLEISVTLAAKPVG